MTTYESLPDQIWSERREGGWKVVPAFVKQLRAKLGYDVTDPAWVFNVCSIGYRIPRPGEPSET